MADGKVHERREIAKAVRAAGLDPQIIGRACDSTFEKDTNVKGRPVYRDPNVPSGYTDRPSVPDSHKPGWMRNPTLGTPEQPVTSTRHAGNGSGVS